MKRIIIFLLTIGLIQQIFAQKNVVDYFNLLPEDIRGGYRLVRENNTWYAYLSDYKFTPVIDIRNGFIEIYDDGSAMGVQGETKLQVVLYREKDGNALIGVNFTTACCFTSEGELNFYEYTNNSWVDVTKEVFPEITYNNFLKKDVKLSKEDLENIYFYYKLPRYGTDITAYMNYEPIFEDECGDNPQSAVCDFLNNIKTESLTIGWDKPNRKFYFKNK